MFQNSNFLRSLRTEEEYVIRHPSLHLPVWGFLQTSMHSRVIRTPLPSRSEPALVCLAPPGPGTPLLHSGLTGWGKAPLRNSAAPRSISICPQMPASRAYQGLSFPWKQLFWQLDFPLRFSFPKRLMYINWYHT